MKPGTILLFKDISYRICRCYLATEAQIPKKHYHIDTFKPSNENFKAIFLETKFYSSPNGDFTNFSLFYVPKINNIAIRCSMPDNFLDNATYKIIYESK